MPWGSTIQQMLSKQAQPLNDSIGGKLASDMTIGGTSATDMTILGRQQPCFKWQNQQHLLSQQQENDSTFDNTGCYVQDCGLLVVSDSHLATGDDDRTWLDLIQYSMLAVGHPPSDPEFLGGANSCSSQPRTVIQCGATVEASDTSNSCSKKRKADSPNETPRIANEVAQTAASGVNSAEKRIKIENSSSLVKSKQESHQKFTSSSSITAQSTKKVRTADSTKQASAKANDTVQKQDYIHVRARRGQATDSHSLAERVRREKISERMKYLQELVPGCNKITGKAGMLDEIINYVQSLQKQVEFLSMKLAAVTPLFDTTPNCFPMTMEKVSDDGISLGMGSVTPQLLDSAYYSTNPSMHISTSGLDTALNLQGAAALLSSVVAVNQPPTIYRNTAFNLLPGVSPGWNVDLQCLLNGDFH